MNCDTQTANGWCKEPVVISYHRIGYCVGHLEQCVKAQERQQRKAQARKARWEGTVAASNRLISRDLSPEHPGERPL